MSEPIVVLSVMFLVGYFSTSIYHWLRDRGWRRATRQKDHEPWRQVPPPNYRCSRGGREYW
jgi:hypothetical protein